MAHIPRRNILRVYQTSVIVHEKLDQYKQKILNEKSESKAVLSRKRKLTSYMPAAIATVATQGSFQNFLFIKLI